MIVLRRIAGCAILLLLLAPWSPASQAADRSLSPLSYRQLSDAREQMDRQQWTAALKTLQALLDELPADGYETALTLQMLGYVQVSREDYPAAIGAFARSLSLEQLPEQDARRLRYDLAQLYLAEGQPQQAAGLLEAWFRTAEKPGAEAWLLLGHAYASQKRYRKAVRPLRRAIELADPPRADWYETLLAMYYELRDYRAALVLLKDMIRLFPQHARYWRQLAAVQLALKDERAALDTLELAWRDGALDDEAELLQLARLYLYNGIPYKSARLMEREMARGRIADTAENRALLARAWSASKHRKQAIRALQRALEKQPSAELGLRLAQWYTEAQDWPAAADTLQALLKGRLTKKRAAQAWLLLGMVRYEQGRRRDAHEAFSQAAGLAGEEGAARQWLRFIDSTAGEEGELNPAVR